MPTSEHEIDESNEPVIACLAVTESKYSIVNFPVAIVEPTQVSMNAYTAQFFSGEASRHHEETTQPLDFAAKRQKLRSTPALVKVCNGPISCRPACPSSSVSAASFSDMSGNAITGQACSSTNNPFALSNMMNFSYSEHVIKGTDTQAAVPAVSIGKSSYTAKCST